MLLSVISYFDIKDFVVQELFNFSFQLLMTTKAMSQPERLKTSSSTL